jgi:hypothetical protein
MTRTGTLYLFFSAYPIVFQKGRGCKSRPRLILKTTFGRIWVIGAHANSHPGSAGLGGLPFLGIAFGMVLGVAFSSWANKWYNAAAAKHGGDAPPEARLPPAFYGSAAIPLALFWFAWTDDPSIHWISPTLAGTPFGFGLCVTFLSINNYLVDSVSFPITRAASLVGAFYACFSESGQADSLLQYTVFTASVLAANAVMRSMCGAAFPLFAPKMYDALGIHWATSVPGFAALICSPFPFVFYKYGATIRSKCAYAAEAAKVLAQLQAETKRDELGEPQLIQEALDRSNTLCNENEKASWGPESRVEKAEWSPS